MQELAGHPQNDRFGRDRSALRLPRFLQRSVGKGDAVRDVKRLLRENTVQTVCEEAKCPNLAECFEHKTATFIIMGPECSRACGFCAVTTGKTRPLDPSEPERIAQSAKALGLKHVVITSVNRDDLSDGGAAHFRETIEKVRETCPASKIEALVPDFCGDVDSIDILLGSPLDVFNHNVETIERLYSRVRHRADYRRSLSVLSRAKRSRTDLVIKSGLMVGLGEKDSEIMKLLKDLRDCGTDIVTIGQYLRPSLRHLPVDRYLKEEAYEKFVVFGQSIGLKSVFAGPFVRSSYHAAEAFEKTQQ